MKLCEANALSLKKDRWFILDVVDNSDFKLDIKNFLDKIDDEC